MRSLIRCTALAGLVAALATCSSPTEPSCVIPGTKPPMSRGPIHYYGFTCGYVGADTIQCTAQDVETGYCADSPPIDITARTEWFTSNPAAAVFTSPGLLKVIGTGQVQVTAKFGFAGIDGDYVYAVALGTTPERLIKLSVILRDAADTERRLPDAAIEVLPERGPSQSCRSSNTGHCEFFVLDGRIRVRAMLEGYEPAEGLAVRPWQDTPLYQHAIFDLRRIR